VGRDESGHEVPKPGSPRRSAHGELALVRALDRALGADDVARVHPLEGLLEGHALGQLEPCLLHEELDLARGVPDPQERELLAEDALGDHAPADRELRVLVLGAVVQALPFLLRGRGRVRRLVAVPGSTQR